LEKWLWQSSRIKTKKTFPLCHYTLKYCGPKVLQSYDPPRISLTGPNNMNACANSNYLFITNPRYTMKARRIIPRFHGSVKWNKSWHKINCLFNSLQWFTYKCETKHDVIVLEFGRLSLWATSYSRTFTIKTRLIALYYRAYDYTDLPE
jgi:hypothetical protein